MPKINNYSFAMRVLKEFQAKFSWIIKYKMSIYHWIMPKINNYSFAMRVLQEFQAKFSWLIKYKMCLKRRHVQHTIQLIADQKKSTIISTSK